MIELRFVRGRDCFDECKVHRANADQLRQIISARAAMFTRVQRQGPFTVKVFVNGELWSEMGPFVVHRRRERRHNGRVPPCQQRHSTFARRSRKRRFAR